MKKIICSLFGHKRRVHREFLENRRYVDGPHAKGNNGFREVWLVWREKKCSRCAQQREDTYQ